MGLKDKSLKVPPCWWVKMETTKTWILETHDIWEDWNEATQENSQLIIIQHLKSVLYTYKGLIQSRISDIFDPLGHRIKIQVHIVLYTTSRELNSSK